MSKGEVLGLWIYGDGKGELLNFQLNNSREYYTAWDDHYVDVNFTGWRYFELLASAMPSATRTTFGPTGGRAR